MTSYDEYRLKHYSPEVQLSLQIRSTLWKDSSDEHPFNTGELLYFEPVGWYCKRVDDAIAYYYPYPNRRMGRLDVNRELNPSHTVGEIAYESVLDGFFSKKEFTLVSKTDAAIAGDKGKKVNFLYKDSSFKESFEANAYFLITKDYVYDFVFIEKDGLCMAMLDYERKFISQVVKTSLIWYKGDFMSP